MNTTLEKAAMAVRQVPFSLPGAGGLRGILTVAPAQAREIAVAVLKAIREPDEGMIEAGLDYDERELNIALGRPPTVEECQAGEWQAMIDHILGDSA